MGETHYLGLLDVIALHAAVMERTGRAPAPLRSEALLESAIMRPRTAAHYEGADLVRQCVLLVVGIAQAQAFLDGNKRTAFAAADVFLRLNGLAFSGDALDLAQQLERIAMRSGSLEEATADVEEWLRGRVARL